MYLKSSKGPSKAVRFKRLLNPKKWPDSKIRSWKFVDRRLHFSRKICYGNELQLTVLIHRRTLSNLLSLSRFHYLCRNRPDVKYCVAFHSWRWVYDTEETPNRGRLNFLRNGSNKELFQKSLICHYFQSRYAICVGRPKSSHKNRV